MSIGRRGKKTGNPSLQAHDRVVRVSDQPYEEIDDRIVLLSIEAGEYYQLNEVGSAVWRTLAQETSVGDLCETVARSFGVEAEIVEPDIIPFLNQLLEHRLISIV